MREQCSHPRPVVSAGDQNPSRDPPIHSPPALYPPRPDAPSGRRPSPPPRSSRELHYQQEQQRHQEKAALFEPQEQHQYQNERRQRQLQEEGQEERQRQLQEEGQEERQRQLQEEEQLLEQSVDLSLQRQRRQRWKECREKQQQQQQQQACAHSILRHHQPPVTAGQKRTGEALLQPHSKRGKWKNQMELADAAAKGRLKQSFDMIPLLEYLKTKPLTKLFKLTSGMSGIDQDIAIESTVDGKMLADGFTEEICSAHSNGQSWGGGSFKVKHMWVSQNGRFVWISKKPKKEATMHNKYLDLDRLVKSLITRYIDQQSGKKPPYVEDFIKRVEDLNSNNLEDYKVLNLWVLSNHPFFMGCGKWKGFIEGFYSFYKFLPMRDQDGKYVRNDLIKDHDKRLCPNWHIEIVRQCALLDLVYWHGRRHLIPKDYYVRTVETRRGDGNYDIYPYTSEDGYLALFQRTFFVHGPDNLKEEYPTVSLSLHELPFIVAYYFGSFLPGFLIEVSLLSSKHILLEECIDTYVERRSISWRAFRKSAGDIDCSPFDLYDEDVDDTSTSDRSAEEVDDGFPSETQDEAEPSKESREQPRVDRTETRYEDYNLPRTFEGLVQSFYEEILMLSKELHDAEDAENSRHRERLNTCLQRLKEINVQHEEKLLAQRASQSTYREESLRKESLAWQQQYQQASMRGAAHDKEQDASN